jgi:hypothetical protein
MASLSAGLGSTNHGGSGQSFGLNTNSGPILTAEIVSARHLDLLASFSTM